MRYWVKANPDKIKKYRLKNNLKVKIWAIAYYGGVCLSCGEHDIDMLTTDHIEGGGNKHRRKLDIVNMYRWLKRNNYPAGFQTLCFNCNHKKYIKGLR